MMRRIRISMPASHNRIPVTTHADLVRDQLKHLPHTAGHRQAGHPLVRAGVAGSGDDLLVLAWSAPDLERERAAGVRLLQRIGLRAAMRIANALPGALATPGSLLFGDVVQDLGGLDVPVGAVENETAAKQAWTLIDLVKPQALVLDRHSATHLLAASPPAQRPWLEGIVWLRTENDHGSPAVLSPTVGFTGWQRTWLAVAEATSFLAMSCAASFFHLDDQVEAEVVDDAGIACAAGEAGTLIVTAHGFETEVARYSTRFRSRLRHGPCACGAAGPVLELDH
jgi:hypothetical protein